MRKSVLTQAALGAVLYLTAFAGHAHATFMAPYDMPNWTVFDNAGGTVMTNKAPASIKVVSGNKGYSGITTFTTTAQGTGLVSFDYSFLTGDWDASWDPFGYIVNGVKTAVVNGSGKFYSGTTSFFVSAGDTFGFFAETVDGQYGKSQTVVSNFSAPQGVPEPTPLMLMGIALLGIGVVRYRRA